MKAFVFAALWVHLTVQTVSFTWNHISLDGGRMLVSWSYDAVTDKLSLQINASTLGWIGFGFALFAPNGMQDYDVILAGYKSGAGYIYDMYSRGPSPPPLDSSQDYKLLAAFEEEGHTILHVERPGSTGDAKDIQFMNNTEVFLVWALHSSLDAINSSIYPFHDRKGSSKGKHILGHVPSIQPKETSFATMPVPSSVESNSVSKNTPNKETMLTQDTAPPGTPMEPKASVGRESAALTSSAETLMNIEGGSKVFSSPLSSVDINAQESSFQSKSSSTEETTWNQSSLEDNQHSAGTTLALSPSSSTDLGSGSSSRTSTTPLSSPPEKGKEAEQGTGFTLGEGKYQMRWKSLDTIQGALLMITCCLFVIIITCLFVRAKERKIRQGINMLPQNNPTICERRIQQLHKQILALGDDKLKEELLNELKDVAYLGLHKDLKELLDAKALILKSLSLVLAHLTDVSTLAEVLHLELRKPEEKTFTELKIVSKRLVVLGEIKAQGIDVTKKWVKALCKDVSSLEELRSLTCCDVERYCNGATKQERDEAYKVIDLLTNRPPFIPQDVTLKQQKNEDKARENKKLQEVKDLMMEVEEMQSDSSSVEDKLNVIAKTLELPIDWFAKATLDERHKKLREVIEECTHSEAKSYKSEVEIITNASKGRTLRGIYHSDFDLPKPAGLKLLQVPRMVTLKNPHSAVEMEYKKFSKKGYASACVKNVIESSTLLGLGMSGGDGALAAEVEWGTSQQTQQQQYDQESSTTASALHYIRIDKRTFQLRPSQLRLTLSAQREAMSIIDTENKNGTFRSSEDSARDFLYRYGSHYPEGVQTLGGMFFSIADAESKRTTRELTEATVNHLKVKISSFLSGAFGIEARAVGAHDHIDGENKDIRTGSDSEEFTLSMKSMGPQAQNPAIFRKLLSYSSNWALIDRGSPRSYRPVWELLKHLGREFEEAARVLENTWRRDESNRKEKDIEQRKRRRKWTIKHETEEELKHVKDQHLRSLHRDNAEFIRPQEENLPPCKSRHMTTRETAYRQAIEFIVKDPELHFCEIVFLPKRFFQFGNEETRYIAKCWQASPDNPVSFRPCKEMSVLFFSEKFQWKNEIPGQGKKVMSEHN